MLLMLTQIVLQDADTTDEIESESKKEEVEDDAQVCLCCYHTLDLTLLTYPRSWRVYCLTWALLLVHAAGPSGWLATCVYTVKGLLSQQSHLKHHIQKLKGAVTDLRE